MTKKLLIPGSSEAIRHFHDSARGGQADADFQKMMAGYSLTTARIFYGLPDAPSILQEYIWQEYDIAPGFPNLVSFLDFWQRELDGKVKKVLVANTNLIKPQELKMLDAQFVIN
jgi:uncharacterized protein Usg